MFDACVLKPIGIVGSSRFIYIICIYLRILVSTISISDDVLVVLR